MSCFQKSYTLDLSTWCCGQECPTPDDGIFIHQEKVTGLRVDTPTMLLNAQGYSCCLGQFAAQVGIAESSLLNRADPARLSVRIGRAYDPLFVRASYTALSGDFVHTYLASECMFINDSVFSTEGKRFTVLSRLQALTTALWEHGVTLTVIDSQNYAPEILKEYQDWRSAQEPTHE